VNNAHRRDAYLGHRLYPWVFLASFSRVLRVTENVLRVVFLTRTNKNIVIVYVERRQFRFEVVTQRTTKKRRRVTRAKYKKNEEVKRCELKNEVDTKGR